MGRIQKTFSYLAFASMIFGLAVVASAQYRGRDNRNGNYTYGRDISSTVNSLKTQAKQFERTLDRELDRSRYDGSAREDDLNRRADTFRKAADKLENKYSYRNQDRGREEARDLIMAANSLDRALKVSRIGRNNYTLSNSWASIENSVNVVAQTYNMRYTGSYGRNGGWDDRDDNRNNRRNQRGNRDGRWGQTNGRYNSNISSAISNLKYKAKAFEDKLDDDRYDRNGSNLEGLSDRFKNAVDDLADEYDDGNGYGDGQQEAQKVLSIAEQLDREIANSRVGRNVKNDWNNIESDLKTIAREYNLVYRGNNRNFGGLGDLIRNFPF